MKTQVFKNSESVNITIYDVLFASIIVFAGILLFAANSSQSFMGDGSVNALSKQDFFKNETMKNSASATEFSMAKMYEYLIPETEPKLEVGNLSSIVFPDVEMVKLTAADNTLGIDYFLKDLKNQANEKTREAVEHYELQKKVKEYLSIETEKPLCLEDWMLNRKCWCPELQDAMSLSEGK